MVVQRVRDLGEDGVRLTVRVEDLGRDHVGVPQWPLTPDGTRYALMVSGGLLRPDTMVFATTHAAALDAVIRGYARMTPAERTAARLEHAIGVRRQLAFEAMADHPDALTRAETELLVGAADGLPAEQVIWDAPVPFFLVDLLVHPHTGTPAVFATSDGPRGPAGPVHLLRAATEPAYLPSLDTAGFLTFATAP